MLEGMRGGLSLLWTDGREARRFALGVAPGNDLALALRAPRLPVHVAARETIALGPHGRLRGYVQIPLVPTVMLMSSAASEPQVLLELPTRGLAPEWDDRSGTVYRAVSPLHVRFPVPASEPRAIVPLWIANPTASVACPGQLPIDLVDAELRVLRGSVVAGPRRLRWSGDALASFLVERRPGALR